MRRTLRAVTAQANEMWDGFFRAIVRLELPNGPWVLHPADPSDTGDFPFSGPVHIITAYNPGGGATAESENQAATRELERTVRQFDPFPTVGSAPDGSFAEPGFGLVGISHEEALALGTRFGQAAIYCWTAQHLAVCGVGPEEEHRMGWRLAAGGPPNAVNYGADHDR